ADPSLIAFNRACQLRPVVGWGHCEAHGHVHPFVSILPLVISDRHLFSRILARLMAHCPACRADAGDLPAASQTCSTAWTAPAIAPAAQSSSSSPLMLLCESISAFPSASALMVSRGMASVPSAVAG